MADAERDRLELTAQIEQLQMDKQQLEASNAAKIDENRALLDQLEALNNTAVESDAKIRTLEASLLSSMQTVRRLESSAARASVAERHLALLEEEQDKLHRELRTSKEDARTHSQRFREAQRGITDMQDQLERMESEALQERERHAEVIQRMERQREMEKQLDTAAGRLKGAAATRSIQSDPKNTKIVGHFVRDLLQDNANLQLGIAELREMLMNSNDEIQTLREQLMYHQPMDDEKVDSPASTLKAELEGKIGDFDDDGPIQYNGPRLSQELHIHHHYHVSPSKELKKPKKKRQGLLPGIFTPPTSSSAPSTPPQTSGQWGIPSSPTAPALLSREYDETTPTTSKPPAWLGVENAPSEFSSSVPSSPFSNGKAVFDNNYGESSDPLTSMTSPTTSFDPSSPTWRAMHTKHASIASSHSFQSLSCLDSEPDLPSLLPHSHSGGTIPEEDEGDANSVIHEPSTYSASEQDNVPDLQQSQPMSPGRRSLHRTTSHESIMSLSGGLDIHTLKIRPSQMTLRPLGGADAVVTGVIAQPTLSRASTKRSDVALRDNFMGLQSPRTVSSPVPNGEGSSNGSAKASDSVTSSQNGNAGSSGLRGWVAWRPWGGSSSPNPNAISRSSTPKPSEKGKDRDMGRSPGINQPGAIPGFQQYWAAQKRKGAPAKVTAEAVDHSALTDGLQG